MKNLLLILLLFVCVSSNAQYVVGNHYQPQSFEEMVAPFLMYNQAFERAVDQFNVYFSKAQESIEKGNFSLAKTYLNQCQQLNKRFNGNLCPSKDLSQWIDYCDNQIKYQEAFGRAVEQFNNYLNKAKESIDNGNYSMGKYYLDQCKQLNNNFNGNICSRYDLDQWIGYCNNQIELQQQLNAFNNTMSVQYQTVIDNNSCKIVKVSATNKYTTLEFDYINLYGADGWCNIKPTAYIVDRATGKKLKLLWAEGIPKSPNQHSFKSMYETLHFKLVFPAVSTKTTTIDMIESNDSSWQFYNIKIR